MLGLAHVGEAGAAGALGPAVDDLDAEDVAAVDLEPHLDADLGELAAQQDGRLDAPPPDADAHAREGLGRAPRRHHQHVAHLGAVRVLLGEEPRPRPRRVHLADLLGVVGAHRVDGRRRQRRDRGCAVVDCEAGADLLGSGILDGMEGSGIRYPWGWL